jgi:uncharacterized protein DUF3592
MEFGSACLLVVLALVVHDQPRPFALAEWDGVSLVFAIVLVVSAGVLCLLPLRDRSLVTQGDLAIGEITDVSKVSGGGRWVRYEFETPLGEKFSKAGGTYTLALSAGMKVPVFYNSQKPNKEVALCSSLYEVRLPQDASRHNLELIQQVLVILPVAASFVLLVRYLGRSDLFMPAVVVGVALGMVIKASGKMRRHWWFWATLFPVAGGHVLLLLRMPWNETVWVPAVALTGLALGDVLIIFYLLKIVARVAGGAAAVKEYFPGGKLTP